MTSNKRKTKEKTCNLCAYSYNNDVSMECHFMPPQIYFDHSEFSGMLGSRSNVAFPEVTNDDWCFQFSAKKSKKLICPHEKKCKTYDKRECKHKSPHTFIEGQCNNGCAKSNNMTCQYIKVIE